MPEQLTFNVINSTTQQSTKTYTCLTENKAFINSIITVGSENTVTETDIKKLQEVAARSGDMGIIEQSDLNGEEKIKLANANGFSDYYELNLSKDGKYIEVTIKDAGALCMDPNLGIIKSDFGIRDGVFVQKGNIPHGNNEIIPQSCGGGSFDGVVISAGKTINIPVSEINISGSPAGILKRFIGFMYM